MDDDQTNTNSSSDEAADLVRARIDALYGETKSESEAGVEQDSLVDKFWHNHHKHPDPHLAWRDYYESLSEKDKLQLWEQYHIEASSMSGLPEIDGSTPRPSTVDILETATEHSAPKSKRFSRKTRDKAKRIPKKETATRSFMRNHVWPIVSAALIVSSVWLVFNNELVLARVKQYISPGNSDLTPVIIDPNIEIGKDAKVIIPKINVDVPVIYDVKTRDESSIQKALERGVVHYGGTVKPGEIGNNVIVGHSSNNFFNGGKYKFAFVLLNRLEIDDTFFLHYKGVRYTYKVVNKQVVDPTDLSLTEATSTPITTLITCDPPGTSWRRLIIQGEQIDPDPDLATTVVQEVIQPEEGQIIPGNSPSLWQRFWNWVF